MTRVGAKGRGREGTTVPHYRGRAARRHSIGGNRATVRASPHVAHAWRARDTARRGTGTSRGSKTRTRRFARALPLRWAARTGFDGVATGSPLRGNGNAAGVRLSDAAPHGRRNGFFLGAVAEAPGIRYALYRAPRGFMARPKAGPGAGGAAGVDSGRGRGHAPTRPLSPRAACTPSCRRERRRRRGRERVPRRAERRRGGGLRQADAPKVVAAPGTEKTMTRGRGEGGAREVGATGSGARKSRRGRFILSQGVRSSSRSNPDTWQKKKFVSSTLRARRCRKPAPPAPVEAAANPRASHARPAPSGGTGARVSRNLARCRRRPHGASRAMTASIPLRISAPAHRWVSLAAGVLRLLVKAPCTPSARGACPCATPREQRTAT